MFTLIVFACVDYICDEYYFENIINEQECFYAAEIVVEHFDYVYHAECVQQGLDT